ncbi:hypothetical protein [Acaricomes phytoseiuli]|uniref:hypothetical protein n=1 Tax=Acaricomes phytoseiuli TaxID=291968 RepID=UPI00036EBD05|nr:hypothetical protein [Acaricomes phytoseiuli]
MESIGNSVESRPVWRWLVLVVAVAAVVCVGFVAGADAALAIDVSPEQPPGGEKVLTIVKWVAWGGAIAGVIGLIICAIMMMLSHRRGEQPAGALGLVLLGCAIVAGAGTLVGFFIPGV